jgi:lipid-binding SYLF domain-containing protein
MIGVQLVEEFAGVAVRDFYSPIEFSRIRLSKHDCDAGAKPSDIRALDGRRGTVRGSRLLRALRADARTDKEHGGTTKHHEHAAAAKYEFRLHKMVCAQVAPNYMARQREPVPGLGFMQYCVVRLETLIIDAHPMEDVIMKRKIISLSLAGVLFGLAFLSTPIKADNKEHDEDRLRNAGQVLKEILNIPDDIPQNLIDKADCVVVIPTVLKAAFIVGGSYGRGAMTCRSGENMNGPWGAPTMMAVEGGSFGFQIGGEATDFVLLIMNKEGASSILSSKVKLGADASAAAGPVGRDASAETDVAMRAQVLTYSRARGLFAGISLEGSTLRPDEDANERIYGKKLPSKDIALHGAVPVPPAAKLLTSTLNQRSPKNLSN